MTSTWEPLAGGHNEDMRRIQIGLIRDREDAPKLGIVVSGYPNMLAEIPLRLVEIGVDGGIVWLTGKKAHADEADYTDNKIGLTQGELTLEQIMERDKGRHDDPTFRAFPDDLSDPAKLSDPDTELSPAARTILDGLRAAKAKMAEPDDLEALAAFEHERWARATRGMLDILTTEIEIKGGFVSGGFALDLDCVARWARRCETKYEDLFDIDKDQRRVDVSMRASAYQGALATEMAAANATIERLIVKRDEAETDQSPVEISASTCQHSPSSIKAGACASCNHQGVFLTYESVAEFAVNAKWTGGFLCPTCVGILRFEEGEEVCDPPGSTRQCRCSIVRNTPF